MATETTTETETPKLRLFAVKLTREVLILAADEDEAMTRAEDLLNLDDNDYSPEDIDRADDVTKQIARVGVENGKRLLRIVPEGVDTGRMNVARLLAAGALDVEPVEGGR